MNILKNILAFITDPKNTRMLMLAAIAILIFFLLRQCGATKEAKKETQRITNNYEASQDTLEQYKVGDSTWRAEKLGYNITLEELETKYANLFSDFKALEEMPPKTVIVTEFVVKDSIRNVPILVEIDSAGNTSLAFTDTTYHDTINHRFLSGRIPYDIVFNPSDSTYDLVPKFGEFDLTLGMNLNLGLFREKKTGRISIIAETDYPGVTFTKLEGANIMDDPAGKKILRQARKPFGIGINLGYGLIVDTQSGLIRTGPYLGIGISYSPKWLQFGK